MMSLRHLPMRQMASDSTHTTRSAIALPARRERALTSSGVKPMEGPAACTMEWMAVVISVLRIYCHVCPYFMEARGVFPLVPF